MVEARRERRRRRLDNLEIPDDQLIMTDDLLGKGGYGVVYLADFNGRNAAAKVMEIKRNPEQNEDPESQGALGGERSVRRL